MPERIPELDRFLTHTEETPMMPASEVRRRGDRRRTVRRSAMGAGALALTVVAGFGLAQTPLFDGRAPDPDAIPLPADPTSEPAPTWPQSEEPRPTDPAAPAPSWANVPAADELFHAEVPAEVRAEQEGLPQAALSFCDPGAYGDPHTILVRDYGAIGFEDSVSAVVFGYDSSDEAAEGFALLQDAALDCQGVYEENSYTNVRVDDSSGAIPFDPPADMAAQVGYITAVGNSPATPDVGTWTEMVMLHADSRVLYVTQEFDGMDNNCSVAPDPDIEQCVLAAAVPDLLERLMRVS